MIDVLEPAPVTYHEFRAARTEFRQASVPEILAREQTAREVLHLSLTADRMLHRIFDDAREDASVASIFRIQPAQDGVQAELTSDQLATAEQYLRHHHGYFFHIADRIALNKPKKQPAKPDAEQTDIPAGNYNDEFIRSVTATAISYIRSRQGLGSYSPPEWPAVRQIITAVAARSDDPRYQKFLADFSGDNPVWETIRLLDQADADVQVAMLDPVTAGFAARDWRQKEVARRRAGAKIIETGYHRKIIDRCDRIGDRENGIGGKMFFGPPGTGKTELAIHHAERNGFATRVVSMHYWQTFNSLVYETSVRVSGQRDRALSYQQRMITALDLFGSMDDDGFMETMADTVAGLQQQGRIAPETTVEQYLAPFLSAQTDQSGSLRERVLRGVRSHAAAASFGSVMTEDDFWEEVVKGEILLAIEAGQDRVILDEMDKAGPTSYDGLSRILAMSGGKTLDVRGRKITIPKTFRIDATANSMNLNEFMKSRFNAILIDYPPARDELAILSVKLSDDQGNILLDEADQARLVAFYTYVLPQIRQLYRDQVVAQPFDLRISDELCNLLVDPVSRRRTGISLERAFQMILFEQRSFVQINLDQDPGVTLARRRDLQQKRQHEASGRLQAIISEYPNIFFEQAEVAGQEDRELAEIQRRLAVLKAKPAKGSPQEAARRQMKQEILTQAYQAVLYSPIVRASLALPGELPQRRSGGDQAIITREAYLRPVKLTKEQRLKIKKRQERKQHSDGQERKSAETGIGTELIIGGASGDMLQLVSYSQAHVDRPPQVIYQRRLFRQHKGDLSDQDISLADVSVSGTAAVIELPGDEGMTDYMVADLSVSPDQPRHTINSSVALQCRTVADGLAILIDEPDTDRTHLSFPARHEQTERTNAYITHGVSGIQVNDSQNGILLEMRNGETWFIDLQQLLFKSPERPMEPTVRLPGTGWSFGADNLLVQAGQEQAFVVSHAPRPKGREAIG